MRTIKPLADHVLVRPTLRPATPNSKIITLDAGQPLEGVVVEVGPGTTGEYLDSVVPPAVAVGDLVAFVQHTGREILLDGRRYQLLAQSDILGRIVQIRDDVAAYQVDPIAPCGY